MSSEVISNCCLRRVQVFFDLIYSHQVHCSSLHLWHYLTTLIITFSSSSHLQDKLIFSASKFKPHPSFPPSVTGTRWFRGTLCENWWILRRIKQVRGSEEKSRFDLTYLHLLKYTSQSATSLWRPQPPLKGFINIRNCKVKESWHSPQPLQYQV